MTKINDTKVKDAINTIGKLQILKDHKAWVIVRDEEGTTFCGRLDNFGVNPNFPSWGFVLVIQRTPVKNVKVKSIKVQWRKEGDIFDSITSVESWMEGNNITFDNYKIHDL